jgi:ribosomal protein S11
LVIGKWVLEVLKEHPYAAQMAAEDCSKVALKLD